MQYSLAKYLFSNYARRKMEGNPWMEKIDASFRCRPYRVALIWRFSPLPEFVKNVGPALVPGLRTRYQALAILTHGLPFTALWSCMGNEAAIVAGGVRYSAVRRAFHPFPRSFSLSHTRTRTLSASFDALPLTLSLDIGGRRVGPSERAPEAYGGGDHVDRTVRFSDPIRHVDQGPRRIGGRRGGGWRAAAARWSGFRAGPRRSCLGQGFRRFLAGFESGMYLSDIDQSRGQEHICSGYFGTMWGTIVHHASHVRNIFLLTAIPRKGTHACFVHSTHETFYDCESSFSPQEQAPSHQ